jgi:hypothetical protein
MTVYTLFGQAATGSSIAADSASYTLGMQFTLSQSATLTGIWFYSASGAGSLPYACAIYQMTGTGTGTVVSGSQNLSPSWSGAAGSGWVKCSYASGPVLAASTVYKVVVLGGSGGNWYSATPHYWDTGAGSSGQASGIITAPDSAAADGGQDSFNVSGSLAYPDGSFNATNYWIDVEVTTASTPVSDSDTASGADSGTIGTAGADSGAGAEAGSISVLPGTDIGSGADSSSVATASGDTGTGADTAAVTAFPAGADTGNSADAGLIGVTATDSGTGADAGAVIAAVPGADTGTGADAAHVTVAVQGADTGTGADSASAGAISTLPLASQIGGTAASMNGYGGSAASTNTYGGSVI